MNESWINDLEGDMGHGGNYYSNKQTNKQKTKIMQWLLIIQVFRKALYQDSLLCSQLWLLGQAMGSDMLLRVLYTLKYELNILKQACFITL